MSAVVAASSTRHVSLLNGAMIIGFLDGSECGWMIDEGRVRPKEGKQKYGRGGERRESGGLVRKGIGQGSKQLDRL